MATKKATKATPLSERFAVNMRALRAKANLSQEALAVKSDVSVSYVSMLERGQRTPPLDTVEAISRGLGLPDPLLLLA